MTGGPGPLPEPPNPSGTLPSPLCLSGLRQRKPAAATSTVLGGGRLMIQLEPSTEPSAVSA